MTTALMGLCPRDGEPVGALHDAGDFDAGGGAKLGEDVADVGLDGLGAEEYLLGDLAVGLAVDDTAGYLELAFGERIDPSALGRPWLRAAVDESTRRIDTIVLDRPAPSPPGR